jgi:hypothetical protein
MVFNEGEELDAQDAYLFVRVFDFERPVKVELLGFVKDLAVEPVLAGVLVSYGRASWPLSCYGLL